MTNTETASITPAKVRAALRSAGIKAPTVQLAGIKVQDFGRDGIIVRWDPRTGILNGTSRDRAIDRAAAALTAKNIPFERIDAGTDRGGQRTDLRIGGTAD